MPIVFSVLRLLRLTGRQVTLPLLLVGLLAGPAWAAEPSAAPTLTTIPLRPSGPAKATSAAATGARAPADPAPSVAAVHQFAIAAAAWTQEQKQEKEAARTGATATNILSGTATGPIVTVPRAPVRGGSSIMAPPTAAPGLLPPIPSDLIGSLPANPTIPSGGARASTSSGIGSSQAASSSIPADNGDRTPGGVASTGPLLPYNFSTLSSLLSTEAQRMALATAPGLAVALVVEGTPEANRLETATHLYVGSSRAPVAGPYDYGLSTLFLPDSAPLGGRGASCMLILHPNDGARLWARFVAPLAQVSRPESGAAFLVGHAVGHCLDAQARLGLDSRMVWYPKDASELASLGVWPDSAWAAYGNPMNKDAYWSNPGRLNKSEAQQQFAERGADALGAAWMIKLGAAPSTLKVLETGVLSLASSQAHATGPIWPVLMGEEAHFRSAQRLPELWALAQAVRTQVGVSTPALAAQADDGAAPDQSSDVRHWKVTAAGLIPVDDKGVPIPGAKPAGAPINFNDLKPFGQ